MKQILKLSVYVFAATMCSITYADRVDVYNKSSDDLYAAVYYIDGVATRSGKIYELPAGRQIKVSRPPLKRLSKAV